MYQAITDSARADIPDFETRIAESLAKTHPPRVLAVVCTTRPFHLGDDSNGLDQVFSLQHEYPGEAFFVINDTEISTYDQSPGERREAILNAACACLALGLDERKAILYRQSDFPQALELLWHLQYSGVLRSVEDAAHGSGRPNPNYLPVNEAMLFAASGLGIRATVMAGKPDQISGCYYANQLASDFNHRYGRQVFASPTARLVGSSVESPVAIRPFDKSCNCSTFTGRQGMEEMLMRIMTDSFSAAAARYAKLRKEPGYVWDVLREGAYLARIHAEVTINAMRQAMGTAQI